MNWDALDYVAAAVLLGTVAILLTLAFRRSGNRMYRAATLVAVLSGFLLLWSNGAVGIIGSADNDANMLYLLVPVVAVLGALLARFRPRGLSRAMAASAAAQLAVPVLVHLARIGDVSRVWSSDVVIISAFFVVLWLLSALLFRRADDRRYRQGRLTFK